MYPVRALATLEGGTFNPGKQMSTMNTIHGGITDVKDQYDRTSNNDSGNECAQHTMQ